MSKSNASTQTHNEDLRTRDHSNTNLSWYVTAIMVLVAILVESSTWLPWIQSKMVSVSTTVTMPTDHRTRMSIEGIVMFRKYDRNHDGVLSMEEFESIAHVATDVRVRLHGVFFLQNCIFGYNQS